MVIGGVHVTMRLFIVAVMLATPLALAAVQDADRIEVVLPRDAIPAIDKPEFEPAANADRVMADEELVIGIVGEREQRAYSTWQLDRHEIVNDTFEGRPIAVTWCPLCGTGIVYARGVAGRTLTFGVSGMLYKDGLVMYDRQTDSLWTQVDGRAVRGSLAGRQLEIVPAVHATWKEWVALYPRSQVLKKRGEFRSPYEDYNRDPRRLGIMGRRNADDRLPGKERILGIRAGNAAIAFPIKAVRDARLAQAEVGGLPVLLVAPAPDLPVLAYERRARSRELTFRLETVGGQTVLRDVETNSTWEIATGKAIAGPMAGAQLNRATAYPAFWFGWRGYFPATAVWDPPAARR